MKLKKMASVLVCLICVFVFLAAAEESITEKQLHSVTKHSMIIGGEVVDYTVTTGTIPLLDVKGEQDLTNFIQSAYPER
jgi:hypothetical protein